MIDLDLLLMEDVVMATEELTLPHPAMAERRFVLEPLAEIAAGMVEPVSGLTVGGDAGGTWVNALCFTGRLYVRRAHLGGIDIGVSSYLPYYRYILPERMRRLCGPFTRSKYDASMAELVILTVLL